MDDQTTTIVEELPKLEIKKNMEFIYEAKEKYDPNGLQDIFETIRNSLNRRYYHTNPDRLTRKFLDWSPEVVTEFTSFMQESKMKPGKAVSLFFHKQFDMDMSEEEKAYIGNKLAVVNGNKKYKVVITLGCAGNSREYYHANSCWWGGFSNSRDWVESAGGGSIRIYDPATDKIMGRVWFVPAEEGIVIFNAYGDSSLEHIYSWGVIVASGLKTKYCNCRFYPSIDDDQGFYINSHNTVYFGHDAVETENPRHINLDFEKPTKWKYGRGYSDYVCSHCNNHFHDESSLRYVESVDDSVCDSCLDDYFAWISTGGHYGYYPIDDCVEITRQGRYAEYTEWVLAEDGGYIEIDGVYYSDDDDRVAYCDHCNEYVLFEDTITTEAGHTYCTHHDNWFQCEDCSTVGEIEDGFEINGNYYCESCRDLSFAKCERCNEWDTCLNEHDDKVYCDNCFAEVCFTCADCQETFYLTQKNDYNGLLYCDNCNPITMDNIGEYYAYCKTIEEEAIDER